MSYPSEEQASKAFGHGQGLKMKGKNLTVLYARLRLREAKNKERRAKKRAQQREKGATDKKPKQQEGGEDEDDDDDEGDSIFSYSVY